MKVEVIKKHDIQEQYKPMEGDIVLNYKNECIVFGINPEKETCQLVRLADGYNCKNISYREVTPFYGTITITTKND